MSKIVTLFRHTKAKPPEYPSSDFERKLSNEGKACASFMATKLFEKLNATLSKCSDEANNHSAITNPETIDALKQLVSVGPDKIICSSSRRTRETLQNFKLKYDTTSSDITYTDATYEASTGSLLNELQQLPNELSTVMMVGHNPGTELLAKLLMGNSAESQNLHFSTGTITVLAFENLNDWTEIGGTEKTAILLHYLNPKNIGWHWEQ